MAKISVIIPIYNAERYLCRCVESLLGQTCREFEIILVDDGSADSSPALCDDYAARHPHLIRVIHKDNGGPSSARNAGLKAARGEFVIFPDPDDWVEPDYVQTLLELQQEFRADLVCIGYSVDTDGQCVPSGPNREPDLMSGPEAQRGLLLPPRLEGFSWSKLYRMELIRSHGLTFPEDIFLLEDLYFAYRYTPLCRTVCCAPSRRVYHYCQSGTSITADVFDYRKLDAIRVLDHILADCGKRDPALARAAADKHCTTAVNLLWLLQRSGSRDRKTLGYLKGCIRRTLPVHLRSGTFGPGRKLQAVLALLCPRMYMRLKDLVRKFKESGRCAGGRKPEERV